MAELNWHYIFTVIVIACGSIPKGYDEGGFAAASGLESFMADFHLTPGRWDGPASQLSSRRSVVTSLGVLGAALGAVAALAVTDRIGRLRAWQSFAAVWMTGFLTTTFSSGNVGLLLFARIWAGVGAGGLTVVAPLYLAEIAPSRTRGKVVSIYMVVLLFFLMAGFFVNYAVLKLMPPSREQYRIVLAVPQIPVGLVFIGSLFLDDTPRWLASRNRDSEALAALARLRGRSPQDASVVTEFAEMQRQLEEKNQTLADATPWTIATEVMTIPSYRRRFLLGLTVQTIAQWSGGNGITYYIPEMFRLAGVATRRHSLITAGSYGATKLLFTVVFAWGLVDYLGRRRCLLAGLALQCVAHVYMALYMALLRDAHIHSASTAAVASIFIYAIGWSIGLCTVQYLYGTEILPTRIRGVCYAVNMTAHWLFQFAVVAVTPTILSRLHVWGAYVFWAAVCAVGLLFLGLWAPETKGVSIESMADLFSGPWYEGWRVGSCRLHLEADIEVSDQVKQVGKKPSNGILLTKGKG
ncbi:hypothetical protein CP533_6516 [Ophiocordyceps camponoti-saundersi (nom. inval.)]|nr:hypothetical protein CP533_6516 [Ophiocordyceps camponoti-saundersi (nom. inval.)]